MFRSLDLTPFFRLPRLIAPLACVVAGCGGEDLVLPDDGSAAASIAVVDGDGQRGPVGQPLDAPIVVEVRDAGGDPVEGVTVEFAVTSAGAGAGVTPSSARTGAEGRAEALVVLGDKVGVQTGEARVAGGEAAAPKTTFSALAEEPANRLPIADFGWSCEDLTCRFTDASSDGDGSVAAWAWRFGDGGTSADREPTHRYAAPGTYTVRLTVTDDGGARSELSDDVRVTNPAAPPSNEAPRADFDVSCDELICAFTDRSEDEDGTIDGWHWDFGDGTTSTRREPTHAYDAPGRYEVVLTVTDDDGAEDARTGTVEPAAAAPPPPPEPPEPPAPPPNEPPEAEFEVVCDELTCSFTDRSEDPDDAVESWRWDFGDGATSVERNPSHTYSSPGRYDVVLTVTDEDGATDSRTRTAAPQAPAPPPEPPPPPAPNEPPDANFDVRCEGLTCSFADKSKDDDGTLVSWQWSFGDGEVSSEQNPVHTYASPGRVDVLLTVTDDRGATDSKQRHADPKGGRDK